MTMTLDKMSLVYSYKHHQTEYITDRLLSYPPFGESHPNLKIKATKGL